MFIRENDRSVVAGTDDAIAIPPIFCRVFHYRNSSGPLGRVDVVMIALLEAKPRSLPAWKISTENGKHAISLAGATRDFHGTGNAPASPRKQRPDKHPRLARKPGDPVE